MELKLIPAQFKSDFKAIISGLLKGEIETVEVDSLHPSFVIDVLKELDIDVDITEMDTNGWQWDYWINFNHQGKKYIISGSGYYGKLKIRVNTDDGVKENEEFQLESNIKSIRNEEIIKENELCLKIVDLINEADELLKS